MSFEFDVEDLYDATVADQGVDFPIVSNGKNFGTFRLRYVDPHTTAGELEMKRVRAQYAKEIRTQSLDTWQAMRAVLVGVNLVGWSGIKAKGKEVAFSEEAALAYFSNEKTRWIMLELSKLANDPANFVSDEEFNAKEIAGNSAAASDGKSSAAKA